MSAFATISILHTDSYCSFKLYVTVEISLPLAFFSFFVLENLISEQREESKEKVGLLLALKPFAYTKVSIRLLTEIPTGDSGRRGPACHFMPRELEGRLCIDLESELVTSLQA